MKSKKPTKKDEVEQLFDDPEEIDLEDDEEEFEVEFFPFEEHEGEDGFSYEAEEDDELLDEEEDDGDDT
jgi:hypothetical protein